MQAAQLSDQEVEAEHPDRVEFKKYAGGADRTRPTARRADLVSEPTPAPAAPRARRADACLPLEPIASSARSGESRDRKGNFIELVGGAEEGRVAGQSQVIHSTVVVLVACIIVGLYLYLNDQVWKVVVQKIFLGQ